MMTSISKYIRKKVGTLLPIVCFLLPMSMVSCQDFFDVDSNQIIDASNSHLTGAKDTLYSVTGILTKLQTIADRTVLLGEARGDLVNITSATSSDLRDLALFQVGDDNQYNAPVDYYSIINNCNYFIANADTAMRNNRGDAIFKTEYNAVKAIRAWTYLQLVTTYGKVPFVTEPILSESMADVNNYPTKDIQGVCNYFLTEDSLQEIVNSFDDVDPESYNYPSYGTIKNINSKLFYFPLRIVLGDLNLWAGNYFQAAKCYYDYITHRNGKGNSYSTGINDIRWRSSDWLSYSDGWYSDFHDWTNSANSEVITIIPTDSLPSEGHYSQLRNIFNTYPYSDSYEASLIPSQSYKDLSAAQTYILYEGNKYVTAPKTNLANSTVVGDLRYFSTYSTSQGTHNGSSYDIIYNGKYYSTNQSRNTQYTLKVNVYRRTLVYLRLAEALNRAGYPEYAFRILSSGVNNEVVTDEIIPHYSADSTLIADNFGFTGSYSINTQSPTGSVTGNTQGIHSRGSGYTPANENYQMPYNPNITDSLEQIAWQQEKVEDMIVDEEALEFAFEGYRFYDLMRIALRRNDPSYLAKKINARNGSASSGVTVDLTNKENWFLKWKGQIGY